MTNWKEYKGTDEQIAEIGNSIYANGFITRNCQGIESNVVCSDTTHYLIIPNDPLREMKIRQAVTGQLVWVRLKGYERFSPALYREYWWDGKYSMVVTTTPDWNIPNAEYSFTNFED